jgi:hypothetical protein
MEGNTLDRNQWRGVTQEVKVCTGLQYYRRRRTVWQSLLLEGEDSNEL